MVLKLSYLFYIVGGNTTTRSYWQNFTNDSQLLVYVLDGADESKYEEAKATLKNLLDNVGFNDIACLLVSNKQVCKLFNYFFFFEKPIRVTNCLSRLISVVATGFEVIDNCCRKVLLLLRNEVSRDHIKSFIM